MLKTFVMEMIVDVTKRYSYADYLSWIDNKRRELFNGLIKMMTPAPSRVHQRVASNLHRELSWYLKRKKCRVFFAPFDVRLPNNGEKDNDKIFTVVQPDISIICDLEKLDEAGCIGAPDMIIEIVSPSNSKRDVEEKFQLYQQHGVKEYWIVFPYEKTVNVFILNDKQKYELVGMYAEDAKIPVNCFNGDLIIDLTEIFDND